MVFWKNTGKKPAIMKRIVYSMLALSLFLLPACNSNEDHNEDYADTVSAPGADDINYTDKTGGTPVSPDTATGIGNTDQLPGNEISAPANTGSGSNDVGSNRKNMNISSNHTANKRAGNTNVAGTQNRKQGFNTSGQYDSRLTGKRPEPINTDDRYYKEHPPAHSYGDTAPRNDGVNSVR